MVDQVEVRNEFGQLARKHFAYNYPTLAAILARRTHKKISTRTIQSWMIDLNATSSRTCPAWALKALREHLSENPDQDYTQNPETLPRMGLRLASFADEHEVECAEHLIQRDKRRREKWRTASVSSLLDELAQFEKRTEEWQEYHNKLLTEIVSELRSAKPFEEFRSDLNRSINDLRNFDHRIRETRSAIEAHTEEFRNDEGIAEN